jgi:hypothetical protein
MTIGSSAKRKPARPRKQASQLVAEWTIEQAATPRHVSVSFVVRTESDDAAARCTTRRFLLPSESAAELVDELKEVLEYSAAVDSLANENSTNPVEDAQATYPGPNNSDDAEPMLNHFALGAYGLVGN